MSDILRAGLIGLGMMGRNHARVLQHLEGVELVAVADPLGDRHHAASRVPVVQTIEQLLEHDLDLCVVAAPTEDHEPIGLALAAAGVHAMVEKPLSDDVASARRLVQAFTEAGLVGAVGHIERFNPALQQLRARLEAGELGEIYQIATRRVGPFPGRIRDVGVIKDLATHDVDLTAWVAGSRFVEISARTAHKSGRDHEDLVAATGTLDDGTVTNHLVNWLSPMKERVTVVTGERGAFIADTLTADLTFHANGEVHTNWEAISRFRGVSEGDMVRYAIAKPEPLATEHAAFRDAILGRGQDIVTMQQGLQAVAVAEAMLRSSIDRRSIVVGDVDEDRVADRQP
jgi:UDP-N-acetylglucosamine 3-dehydrogenase